MGAVLALAVLAVAVLVGHAPWSAIGAGIAVLMAGAALSGRRIPTAATSFILGLGPWWDGFIIFGAIYIAFGFVLIRTGRQMVNDSGGPRR